MNITIFGTGYVGLVTAACFADVGNTVLCVDVDEDKIRLLNAGTVPIHEPGLAAVVESNAGAGRLAFTTDVKRGVAHADIVFLAVGTPPDEDGGADLSHVLAVAHTVGRYLGRPTVVVN
ncbi:UDP-glucose/GDP-mannose dehydrogenase family protein, partial [Oxalobacteraceae bacterium OM1]